MTFHARNFGGQAALASLPSLATIADAARAAPVLKHDEEAELARRWRDHRDPAALDRIVRAHMRLVLKRASSYRGYGLPIEDLVSEGHVGLVKSLENFNPDLGYRVSTYAGWWIDAMLKTFVITNWSLVKMGTTADQKRLFFGLRRAKAKLSAYADSGMGSEDVGRVAKALRVNERDVVEMDQRLSGDRSLNVRFGLEGDGDEWMDLLEDDSASIESILAESDETGKRRQVLKAAMTDLKEREMDIFRWRRLEEEPKTLEDLAYAHGVSRERIRQIEIRALEKVTEAASRIARSRGMEFAGVSP